LLSAIRAVNEARAGEVIELLETHLGSTVNGRRIAVLGLAFKPGTNDTRESAGIRVANELLRRGADVVAHDPMVTADVIARDGLQKLPLATDMASALQSSEAGIITTSWPEYRNADWSMLVKAMANPLIFDGRGVVPPDHRGRGFVYLATGRSGSLGPFSQ
jgi:UDP-glucose 6-dehydrogenase